jgi:hypothetical protein
MGPDQDGNFTKPDDDAEVSMLLASGKEWRPFRPRPEDFEWIDIGHGASRIPRFNGQLSSKFAAKPWDNYVIGQHLCLCSDLATAMNPSLPIDVLLAIHLHDGEEPLGGLGDPVGPVKHSPTLRPILKLYFAPILDAIADKARIRRELLHGDPVVKQFDRMAYRIENHYLRGIGNAHGTFLPKRHQSLAGGLHVWSTIEVYENWMETLNELLARKAAQ